MDVFQIVNGCIDVCSKDSNAVSKHMDRSLDGSTCGSMNGHLDKCLRNHVYNGLSHLGKNASSSNSSQLCCFLHNHVGSLEQNTKDSLFSNCEDSCHSILSADVTVIRQLHLPVKSKPPSEEATVVNGNSSLEASAVTDKVSNCSESKVVCNKIIEEVILCEPNTNIDYSCLELKTVPESLYLMPAITELCLDYNDFTELPDALFESLSCLRAMSLLANNLTCLPDSISRLSRLEELNVAQNSLRSLPSSIGTLRHLCFIDFSQNQVSELPPEFGKLSKLEKLCGYENLLTYLPQIFGRLENLRLVDLSGNQLKVLSHSFGFLVQLKSLNLSSNGLVSLPESVTCLSTLECLDVSNNLLTCLPDKLQCLQNLRQLYVANNQLRLLPTWIENLPALEELRLEQNHLTGSPLSDSFSSSCRRLRVLSLGRNFIRNVTNSIVDLENLEWLNLGNGENVQAQLPTHSNTSSAVYNWIWQLPLHFGYLERLRHVDLYNIRLEELPEDFGCLKNLEWLNLGANELHDLPQSFCQLMSLKYLVLSMNLLELLPSDFGNLSRLEELHLDRNRLAELPQSFCQLSLLHHLDLSSNMLTELPLFLQSFARLKCLSLDENCFKDSSLQLTISGNRIQTIKPRISLQTAYCCKETDWLENFESLSRDGSPVGSKATWDGTIEDNSGTEGQADEDNSSRPGSSTAKANSSTEKEEEEEEDWDKEILENNPFVDSEAVSESSKADLRQNCSSKDLPPIISFVPAAWHAPRVNTCRSNAHWRPLSCSPFSYRSIDNDQFEDADEGSG